MTLAAGAGCASQPELLLGHARVVGDNLYAVVGAITVSQGLLTGETVSNPHTYLLRYNIRNARQDSPPDALVEIPAGRNAPGTNAPDYRFLVTPSGNHLVEVDQHAIVTRDYVQFPTATITLFGPDPRHDTTWIALRSWTASQPFLLSPSGQHLVIQSGDRYSAINLDDLAQVRTEGMAALIHTVFHSPALRPPPHEPEGSVQTQSPGFLWRSLGLTDDFSYAVAHGVNRTYTAATGTVADFPLAPANASAEEARHEHGQWLYLY